MASPFADRGADRATPPTDQLAAFYDLQKKTLVAGQLGRHARHAELSAESALQAEALFGEDSLVVASLRMTESQALCNLAFQASGAEQEKYYRRAWALLVSLIAVLLRRLAADTLLPGTVREEELDFAAHQQSVIRTTRHVSVLPPAVLRAAVSTSGYETLVMSMSMSLDLLPLQYLPAADKRSVESFVLQGLDVIPRTAGIPAHLITDEDDLVALVVKMNPRKYDPTFYAAVLRKWRSNAVSGVLRARGVLQTGTADSEQALAELKVRQRADIAKHGLRDCALRSCAKTEKTVKEFAGCSGCRSVVYCCLEHQALDWGVHKKSCREKEAARLAEDEAATGTVE